MQRTALAFLIACVPAEASAQSLAMAGAQASRVVLLHQAAQDPAERPRVVVPLAALNITATRGPREVFRTPSAVSVIARDRIEATAAVSAADLFRELPGVDVEGVGPSQHRPVVRGFRGQRVVLLEDGLRLNHARRRIDSGEPAGLAGIGALERVEVVRGPASVLYGSDAIGGAINLVTRRPARTAQGVHGTAAVGWTNAGDRADAAADITGLAGPIAFRLGAGIRTAGDYHAPAGRYGDVELTQATPVLDSGADERSARADVRTAAGAAGDIFVRVERYEAENAGFGWMDPAAIGGSPSIVRLTFPRQSFWRTAAGYSGIGLRSLLADRVDAAFWVQDNTRDFITEVHSPTSTGAVATRSVNFTQLETAGLRVEAARLVGRRILLTYGIEILRETSTSTDTSTTTITSAGAAVVSARGGSSVPDARLLDAGAFLQSGFTLGPAELILGGRYQQNRAEGLATRGYSDPLARTTDRAFVGAAHLLVRVQDGLVVLGSVSRGFRAPNLIERFFAGNTPEGRGFWLRNEDLGPERSLNLEAGARVRAGRFHAETFVFQNALADGIVLEPTGEVMGRRTVYRNVNVDRLRFRGWELAGGVALGRGFALSGDYTRLDVRDVRAPDRVFAETYPERLNMRLRFDDARQRGWIEYATRHNGGTDGPLPATTVVGTALPAFTVQNLRAGIRAGRRLHLSAAIENLTDRLYAEPLNIGVFRPEPGRSIELRARIDF